MLTIDQFDIKKVEEKHPYDIAKQWEDENTLRFILYKCLRAGQFKPIKCSIRHLPLVSKGLAVEHPGCEFELTEKAKGLLYSVYCKEKK